MKHSVQILLILAAPVVCPASGVIQNVTARQGVSLAGPWRTIVDPYESGYFDYHGRPYENGGIGANKKPSSKSDIVEYDFDASPELRVPGDWNTQRPELLFYGGSIWYKRNFDYHLKPGRRA